MALTLYPAIATTLAFVHVPVTVPLFSGHAGVTTPVGPFSKVRAEEHQDAAGVAALTEMDMGLRHRARERWRCAHMGIRQRIGDRAGLSRCTLVRRLSRA